MNLYTDIDPKCCAWTQELIKANLIPPGDVLCKSIIDIKPHELEKYTQVHLFCGIAGWPYALRLAGWPDDRPVWSSSLPCQSFSSAGKGKGFGDDRGNLWFPFLRLVRELRPGIIVGEQVQAAIGHGWLDRIFTDLEAETYACGACVLGAHSAGAPHIRQRLFWVAQSQLPIRRPEHVPGQDGCNGQDFGRTQAHGESGACGEIQRVADTELSGPSRQPEVGGKTEGEEGWLRSGATGCRGIGRLADAGHAERGTGELRLHAIGRSGDGDAGEQERAESQWLADAPSAGGWKHAGSGPGKTGTIGCEIDHGGSASRPDESQRDGANERLADASDRGTGGTGQTVESENEPQDGISRTHRGETTRRLADASGGQRQQLDGAQGHGRSGSADDGAASGMGHADEQGPQERECNGQIQREALEPYERKTVISGSDVNFWRNSRWHACRDGKARRVPASPGVQFVAPGLPYLVAALRDAGCQEAEIRQACDLFPLASEKITGRVMLLRGAGNSICVPVATEFISAVMETL